MLLLNAAEVRQALPMLELIAVMKDVYAALSAGQVDLPLRTQVQVGDEDNIVLFMPAYLDSGDQRSLCLKSVSVFPRNTDKGIPTIHAAVIVLDPETGEMIAILEGGSLTALRTGAASGAATDLLSREDSRIGAIFGAGVQGRTQLQAICAVRNIEQAWVYDPIDVNAQLFVEELRGLDDVPNDLRIASSPREAVQKADIICTATTSKSPVFSSEDLKPGVHINGIGSFTPEMIEIPPDVLSLGRVFVGSKQGVLAEAGEILAAREQNLINENQIVEIGEVFQSIQTGRTDSEQVTVFKSVGVAAQDAGAAWLAYQNAIKLGIGRKLSW
jgi:ornithine cyclodeaminase